MDLKQFVSATLTELVEGIVDAQKRVKDHGAHINPGNLMRSQSSVGENAIWDNRTNNYARTVSFDVALTVEDGTSTNAKVGVVAGVFGLGAGSASENKNMAFTRVQFSIPVLFPDSLVSPEARQLSRTTL